MERREQDNRLIPQQISPNPLILANDVSPKLVVEGSRPEKWLDQLILLTLSSSLDSDTGLGHPKRGPQTEVEPDPIARAGRLGTHDIQSGRSST